MIALNYSYFVSLIGSATYKRRENY